MPSQNKDYLREAVQAAVDAGYYPANDDCHSLLMKYITEAFKSYAAAERTNILEYLSEQAVEYGITNAEAYAHNTGYDGQMLIPLKAIKELQERITQ